jgi:3-deoxy-manno-octulosonate cytidylyltransferase (CMP-KDO synthetase)
MKAKVVAIIPARMASSRLPGKPLAKICGLTMIEHVRRRARLCEFLEQVIVATCDQEIYEEIKSHGGEAVMTSDRHKRCTDRVAEAVKNYEADIVVNIQGDEPFLDPQHIDALVKPLLENDSLECSNLIAQIPADFADNPNLVKVVSDKGNRALYFSREAIPSRKKSGNLPIQFFRQLGIIAFRRVFLDQFLALPSTPLEAIESCDMMRAVEHGIEVRTVEVNFDRFGVDTQDDLDSANLAMQTDTLFKLYTS